MFYKNILTSILFLILISLPISSFAQDESFFFNGANGISSTSLVVVTLVVGVGLGVYTTNQTKSAPVRKIVYFLKQNKSDFRAALQLGSGAVLDDFSRLLGFENEDAKTLARLLRKHRKFVNKNAINDLSVKNVEVLVTWIQSELVTES